MVTSVLLRFSIIIVCIKNMVFLLSLCVYGMCVNLTGSPSEVSTRAH